MHRKRDRAGSGSIADRTIMKVSPVPCPMLVTTTIAFLFVILVSTAWFFFCL